MSHALMIDDSYKNYHQPVTSLPCKGSDNDDKSQSVSFADVLKALRQLMALFIKTNFSMNLIAKDQIGTRFSIDQLVAKTTKDSGLSEALGQIFAAGAAIVGSGLALGLSISALGEASPALTEMGQLNKASSLTEGELAQGVNRGSAGLSIDAAGEESSEMQGLAEGPEAVEGSQVRNEPRLTEAQKQSKLKELSHKIEQATQKATRSQMVSQAIQSTGSMADAGYKQSAATSKYSAESARASSSAVGTNLENTNQVSNSTAGTLDTVGKQMVRGVAETIQATANGVR